MSKKKSLGSSPVGLASEGESKMTFIPDLGISRSDEKQLKPSKEKKESSATQREKENGVEQDDKTTKKTIVSYSLDANLVDEVKAVASEQNMYYSGLVSKAIKLWLAQNGRQ